MEELTEVITAAEFHPIHCNLFMYSSSKGTIKLADMREAALCDSHAKRLSFLYLPACSYSLSSPLWSQTYLFPFFHHRQTPEFEEEEDPSNKSFFSEIISSISDVKFSKDGRFILSRDYLTLKIWDVKMENKPVKTINIHDHLRGKLCDLYENDCIFDKFECTFSGNGEWVVDLSARSVSFLGMAVVLLHPQEYSSHWCQLFFSFSSTLRLHSYLFPSLPFQIRPHWFLPQLLPHLRRRVD
jgi:serine/threonine-protein phosphatase 2A regulatory subunit B